MSDDVKLPKGIEAAFRRFYDDSESHTHACLVGVPCAAAEQLRRAIAAALRRCEADGLEYDGIGPLTRAKALRAQADALEGK